MSVNVSSRVAPTFGKAQMSVPMSYDIGSLGPGPLGLGPYMVVLGPAVQIFSCYKACPRYKRREEYKRASQPGGQLKKEP
eukprot:6183184-Karenia_brevis.AAC.1